MRRILLALFAQLFVSNISSANEQDASTFDNIEAKDPVTRYQIEFVLFKQSSPDMEVLEYEKILEPLVPASNPVQLYPYSAHAPSKNHLAALNDQHETVLASTANRLRKQNYEILAEGAWQQALDNDTRSRALALRPDKNLQPFWLKPKPNTYETDGSTEPKLASEELSEQSTSSVYLETSARQTITEDFYGELNIKRSRYTHAEIELDYRFKQYVYYPHILDYLNAGFFGSSFVSLVSPLSSNRLAATPKDEQLGELTVKSFKFEQSRRIKNGEIHYLDHPYLGLIVTIKRLKQDELL